MAEYSGFSDYLSIDGTDVSEYLVEVEHDPIIETADVTMGSGTTWRSRNVALKDGNLNFSVGYDDAFIGTLLPLIRPGRHTVVYGPEGNGAGKPKHEQAFIFTGRPSTGNMQQSELRVFAVAGVADGAPTTDIDAGGTF